MARIDAVLIGAGQRGADAYAPFALQHPDRLRFVAVVEPKEARRKHFAEAHGIPASHCFSDTEGLFALGRIAHAAFICTPDQGHLQPARRALAQGYHVLLEKPMATTPEACAELVALSKRHNVRLSTCHGFRHTRHLKKLRELLSNDAVGEVVNVSHTENVAYYHMAHSYVRGSWRRKDESAPMILTKCCHDFDALNWVLREPVVRLASYGSLKHFRADRAPKGAPERCTDGCPVSDSCPFYAPRFYGSLTPLLDNAAQDTVGPMRWGFELTSAIAEALHGAGEKIPLLRKLDLYNGWPRSVLSDDPTPESIDKAMREGPYGRCVYHVDNDVVDHQVVLMQLASGASVTLTMQGHSAVEERVTVVQGSHGSISARIGIAKSRIELFDHAMGTRQEFDTTGGRLDGHGGSDLTLVEAFVAAVEKGDISDHGDEALESHLLAFAAEQARVSGQWVEMQPYRAHFEQAGSAAQVDLH